MVYIRFQLSPLINLVKGDNWLIFISKTKIINKNKVHTKETLFCRLVLVLCVCVFVWFFFPTFSVPFPTCPTSGWLQWYTDHSCNFGCLERNSTILNIWSYIQMENLCKDINIQILGGGKLSKCVFLSILIPWKWR